MGTIILIIFTVFSAIGFYLWDTRQHRKIYVDSIIGTHWNDKTIIEEKNKEIRNEYPVLNKVVNSLLNSEIKYTSKEITNVTKPVKGSKKQELQNEIKLIINNEDEEAIKVLMWYYMACMFISSAKRSKVDSLNEISDETEKIQNKDFDDFDSKDLLCFS